MVAEGQPILEEQGVEAGELEGPRRPLTSLPRGTHLPRGEHHDPRGNAGGQMKANDNYRNCILQKNPLGCITVAEVKPEVQVVGAA